MVERLSALAALLFSAFSSSGVAFSQGGLPDPTRPPSPSVFNARAGGVESVPAGHRLESILISSRRRVAVIDGKTVALGADVAGAKVTSISEAGVTLRRGTATETLRLNPAVNLRFHPPPDVAAHAREPEDRE